MDFTYAVTWECKVKLVNATFYGDKSYCIETNNLAGWPADNIPGCESRI